MISKDFKFPMRTDFIRFRSRASRYTTSHMTIHCIPNTSHSSRLSIVVPKKVSKLATTRNWLKRLIYDTLWPRIKDKSIDCVVVFKPSLPARSLGEGGPLRKSQSTLSTILKELDKLLT